MQGMARLVEKGTVRHVGVSNFNLRQWQTAERLLGGAVLSNQVQYGSCVASRAEYSRSLATKAA